MHLVILDDREEAAYFYNDLYNLREGRDVLFFPSSYRRSVQHGEEDANAAVQRTAALSQIAEMQAGKTLCIVSYAEAVGEQVVSGEGLQKNTLKLKVGAKIGMDFITETLFEYHFERVDFVYEPGQFALRGSIVDIFSFADSKPVRVDFFGDEVESIRSFNLNTQLSDEKRSEVEIVPNLKQLAQLGEKVSFLDFVKKVQVGCHAEPVEALSVGSSIAAPLRQAQGDNAQASAAVLWLSNLSLILQKIEAQQSLAEGANMAESVTTKKDFAAALNNFRRVFFSEESENTAGCHAKPVEALGVGSRRTLRQAQGDNAQCVITFNTTPQPSFNKNFDLLAANLGEHEAKGYNNFLLTDSLMQAERMAGILANITGNTKDFEQVPLALHEGFIDHEAKICCYTDHQIFARYHRYKLHGAPDKSEQFTIQELNSLQVGDYIVHIDHGVGVFGGLVKQMVNGKPHEFIKLTYRDGDVLFVSVHGLHRISRYKGKDSEPPKIYKLGNGAWQKLKNAAKGKVKDIARDLIRLYAKRKDTTGFAFSPDSYLQQELEASFIYEDTPDQLRATQAVKADMEKENPMDRLVCGDVGFGKTEVAMRAAFKAVADSKQVAVLVPTTILALQHHKTFCKRMHKFPCRIEYLSRFKTAAETKKILTELEEGKIDIIIGTHKLLGSTIKFKDLGLLIIDEEQKFGVGAKEKLRQLRLNVDTLTLTATPIPRTLQFSLMGARDLSIIQTPPPNRQPVSTELHTFNEDVIREAIEYEMARGGQAFFVHNRVQDIQTIEDMIRRICPNVKTVVAHGQMEGNEMERRVVDFIMGEFDVLIATSIIENGIDIPNANTIIINQAQNFGLSDMHQLRGRVGRSNRKAFCYLLAPPATSLTGEARRRLRAIEEFSDLGSGFNIAMQDLDIRGAGNLLGGEQSGFIAEIGFETYQKILNEALLELRDEEPTTASENEESSEKNFNPFGASANDIFVTDCNIETDMELLIPDRYVSNTAEKIRLYREMDDLQTEQQIADFRTRMVDRFGALPTETDELLNVVRLRQKAIKLGIEKIILKNNLLIAYFVSNPVSPYYQTPLFSDIMQRIAAHPHRMKVKEQNGKLSFVAQQVKSVAQAMGVLELING
ncbi:MAG: transcription-repair coupling factor [Prevotellaceae bacterium]|nr:transcription-repair coupling factor [Prevotellaceae bacterium]